MMMIPEIKTILDYSYQDEKGEMYQKRILVGYFRRNKKSWEIENDIAQIMPFEELEDYEGIQDVYQSGEGRYIIEAKKENKKTIVYITLETVMDFDGEIFEMKKTSYDMKDYEL